MIRHRFLLVVHDTSVSGGHTTEYEKPVVPNKINIWDPLQQILCITHDRPSAFDKHNNVADPFFQPASVANRNRRVVSQSRFDAICFAACDHSRRVGFVPRFFVNTSHFFLFQKNQGQNHSGGYADDIHFPKHSKHSPAHKHMSAPQTHVQTYIPCWHQTKTNHPGPKSETHRQRYVPTHLAATGNWHNPKMCIRDRIKKITSNNVFNPIGSFM